MDALEQQFFTTDHHQFRSTLKDFLHKEVMPNIEAWEAEGQLPKDIFLKFGQMGFFGLSHEEKYGGSALDFWYDVIFIEEISRCESGGFGASISAHPYLTLSHLHHEGSTYIKEKYLTKGITGERHGALAITEPHAGSDVAGMLTTAQRSDNHYIINGSKCFITNGVSADYYIVACKTNPDAKAAGISLIVVDTNTPGITSNALKKLGWHASDTAEIAFDNVKVPTENLLGEENKGFYYIMQRFELERLTLALGALSSSEWAIEYTLKYMNERKAFGKTINKFQVLRHRIAQLSAEITATKTFCYTICDKYNKGIYCVKEASMIKLLATELSDKVAYQCLQMLGGYGFMEEYKLARFYRDSRLGTIGGGTSEVMLEIISKMVIDDKQYQNTTTTPSNKKITIDELFETLPQRLKTEKSQGVDMLVHFDFGDSNYYAHIQNQAIQTTKEKPNKDIDLVITTTSDTYVGVETGTINPQEAFMSGKIQVSDLAKMMQFGTMFKKYK